MLNEQQKRGTVAVMSPGDQSQHADNARQRLYYSLALGIYDTNFIFGPNCPKTLSETDSNFDIPVCVYINIIYQVVNQILYVLIKTK